MSHALYLTLRQATSISSKRLMSRSPARKVQPLPWGATTPQGIFIGIFMIQYINLEAKMNTIAVNGVRSYYWERNPAGREVVVILHGFPGNHMGLVDLAEELDQKYRIIVPD